MMNDFTNKTCVFIGRFQPFHTGQMMVLEGMVKLCRKTIVVIGSANKSDSKDDPFSWDERREMIQRGLQEKNLIEANVAIIEVSDMVDDAKWIEHVKEKAGAFDAVWTANPVVKKLCEAHGIEVKDVKKVPGFNGEEILQMMRDENAFWDEKIQNSVATYIKSIEGHIRVRNLG